jgi:hypothetical protein
MGTPTQSPAELIRLVIAGEISEIEVCNRIENWASDVTVGGFINLDDCNVSILNDFLNTDFVISWPEGLEMPTDESDEDHADKVKAFRKAASKASKKLKKTGVNVATPFAKISYNAGAELVAAGFCQFHASLVIDDVKIAVHYWSKPEGGDRLFAKFKIDKDAQLALFI